MDKYARECILQKIRDKLNTEKIKLWLSPYTLPSGEKGEIPQEVVGQLSKEFQLPEAEIIDLLESLRQHALQKLAERDKFQKEGIATLKVKMTSSRTAEGSQTHAITMEVNLGMSGSDFKKQLSDTSRIPVEELKLITRGKVIKDDQSLQQQDVKNGAQVMAVRLSVLEAEAHRQQEQASNVAKTREAAELLANKIDTDEDTYDIQIADQSGKPLQLPIEEKKALTLAMTLHEKGRAALKKKQTSQALLLFLEADNEFSKCQAELLKSVDNYAVLCLDIVWCYFSLQNVDQLPDAEWRLEQSEKCFIRSYGANNERLMAVKGGTGSEQAQALFMKLHLLQGIVAFHQHKADQASRLFNQAEFELKSLQVDENLITKVMNMGYKEREARLALRACKGDVERAVEHINYRRQEKKEVNMQVNEEWKERKRAKKLGKTADGEWVDVQTFDMLCDMGFAKGASAEALRQTNNEMSSALEVLRLHPELLNLSDPEEEDRDVEITDEMVAELTALGFNQQMARNALEKHHGDAQDAVEELLKSGGIVLAPEPSTSEDREEKRQREHEALDNLMSDISRDEEDYLDLSLKEESDILSQYKALLASVNV